MPLDPIAVVAIQNVPGNLIEAKESNAIKIQELDLEDTPPYDEYEAPTTAGLILSPALSVEVTEPTDVAYTGAFMAGDGIDFSGIRYVLGQVVQGQIQVGFVEDGGLTALGGNLIVDSTGLSIYGLNLAQYFQATNDGETRRSYLGMYLPQGQTVPVFSIILTGDVGTNLLTNGDAETGDLTGWTDSDGVWSASTLSPYEGSYSFFHDGTLGGFPGYLLQNVAVSAGDIVSIGFAHRRIVGILSGRLVLQWKDGASAVISTDYIYGTNTSSWALFAQNFTAPATTASVDMFWQVGDPFNDEEVDILEIYISDVTNELRWNDETLLAVVNGVEYDLLSSRLVGRVPYVYPIGYSGTVANASLTGVTLAANGGAATYPVFISAPMLLESVSVTNLNTGTQRAWNWALFKDSGVNTLDRVAFGATAETFTPVAISARTITADSAPVQLEPGLYWILIQCTHATNAFSLGAEGASNTLGGQAGQTKTVTNPVGSTLDFVAATWTKNNDPASIRLNGRVFGESTSF